MQGISIEERLPEHGGFYLAYRRSSGWEKVERMVGFLSLWFDLNEEPICDITHWMPLPESPKEPGPFYLSGLTEPNTVCCKGYGVLWRPTTVEDARELRDRLNALWGLDLDKASAARKQDVQDRLDKVWEDLDKGTNEEHHDDNTATNRGTTGSTCCTDGGTCNRSV